MIMVGPAAAEALDLNGTLARRAFKDSRPRRPSLL